MIVIIPVPSLGIEPVAAPLVDPFEESTRAMFVAVRVESDRGFEQSDWGFCGWERGGFSLLELKEELSQPSELKRWVGDGRREQFVLSGFGENLHSLHHSSLFLLVGAPLRRHYGRGIASLPQIRAY